MFETMFNTMISGFEVNINVFTLGDCSVQLAVPDVAHIQQRYTTLNKHNDAMVFPFWSKVWPAAQGLCQYISRHAYYVKGKRILELAAGLGLPSVFASQYAKQVHCTDIIPEAVEFAKHSAVCNNLSNMYCSMLDWNEATNHQYDTVLLSDVNYNSAQFNSLYKVIGEFLERGTTVIISTPQRLMAKPFIELLLPFCVANDEETVVQDQIQTAITVLVLNTAHKNQI